MNLKSKAHNTGQQNVVNFKEDKIETGKFKLT